MQVYTQAPKPRDEHTAEDFVDNALHCLKLWKQGGCTREQDYLITMSITHLNDAMRKLRF